MKEEHNKSKSAQPAIKLALRSSKAIIIFLIIASFAAFTDLWTKEAVFDDLLGAPDLAMRAEKRVEHYKLADPSILETATGTRYIMKDLDISRELCPKVSLTLSTNPGIVFGFDSIPTFVVNIVTVIMIICISAMFFFSSACDYWMHTALALILGGAIGNLYDRLFSSVSLPVSGPASITGHVRDFIDCSELGYAYIFNIADVWLVAGAAMIILQWVYQAAKNRKKTAEPNK